MDEAHLHVALRYVTLNPVRAKLVKRCADWRWSSAVAHLAGEDDHVVKVKPALDRVGDFAAFLAEEMDEDAAFAALRRAETIGRPVGSADWLAALEALTGRTVARGKPGPKRGAWTGTRR
jgi:putative transposase